MKGRDGKGKTIKSERMDTKDNRGKGWKMKGRK